MNTLKKTKEILNKYNLTANKRFGQNFLIDDEVLERIVDVSKISNDDLVIEIGPGLGNLSKYLLDVAGHVLLVEIDKKMLEIINDRFSEKLNYTLINEDVLKLDIDFLISDIEKKINKRFKKVKVVANLPYYVTTPILFKLLQDSKRVEEIVVMVQKEVAERMVASPRGKDYGILTIMVNYMSDAKIEIIVPNSSFIPAPNVTSAVIRLVKNKKYNNINEKILFDIIHKAFAKRRKKMINSLESSDFMGMNKQDLQELVKNSGLGENVRAEELLLEDFVRLVEMIDKLKKK